MKDDPFAAVGSAARWLLACWMGIVICASGAGCSRLETEYGSSYDTAGRRSIAGFGVLREAFRRRGWNDRTVSRLSERLNNVDAIVWTPSVEAPPAGNATEWMEQWLAIGDKTLIYVLRDHETVDAYWSTATPRAAPDQRLEYRRRSARARMEKLQALLVRPATISNGWFTAVSLSPPAEIGKPAGEWAAEMPDFALPLDIEYRLRAYDPTTDQSTSPIVAPTIFGLQSYTFSDTPVDFEVPLATESGTPLVARVTSEQWNGSQILVVAGGSLIDNFGLLDPASRQLASRLIEESGPRDAQNGKVGFLFSNELGVNISSLDPEKMGPTGMEMLTTWPLSLLTIHAVMLALIVCLMLLPIFGRPRRLPPRSSTDFAEHVNAVAALMARTRGDQYARVRISEYMVRIRGENEGPWVIPPAVKADGPIKSVAPQPNSITDDTPTAAGDGPADSQASPETR